MWIELYSRRNNRKCVLQAQRLTYIIIQYGVLRNCICEHAYAHERFCYKSRITVSNACTDQYLIRSFFFPFFLFAELESKVCDANRDPKSPGESVGAKKINLV